jgi:signal transduction histidine kinase
VDHWVEVGKALQVGIFSALALATLRLWRSRGSATGARLTASFAVLAAVSALFWVLPESGWAWAQIVAAAVLLFPLTVAARMWSASRALATIAGRRMRMLSVGLAVMTAGLLVGGLVGASAHPAVGLSSQVLSLAAALFFLLGFAPPAVLRAAWRRREEAALREGELELMKASTPEEVAAALLDPIARMLGGEGALMADKDGCVVAAHGLADVAAAQMAARAASMSIREPSFHGGVLTLPLRCGWLVVHASPDAPFFGDDEIALVQRLGLVIDMALERTASLQVDRAAREDVEQAHAEMESLLYTVSHDLKSPLLTVLGYIDLLRTEGSVPEGQAGQFMDRMEASALYMQQLINDLLELSRIGRRDAAAEAVDLADIVADVADELRTRAPSMYVGIGLLPVVTMSPVRARQLMTNLLDNAVVHSGRADVTIEVGAQRRQDGAARIWVADDGQGVPCEHRERVFGVFERCDARPSGDAGTGIGLAACRKIVEQLGGSIRLLEAQRGTRVEIVLPAESVRWQPSSVAVGG